jgi:protein-disulfide isomerase
MGKRFHAMLICAGLMLSAPLILSAQDSQKPLATVAGQPIYEQDLMSVAGPGLLDLRKQEYKLKSDALEKVIRTKLIEVEAKKRGLSTEELLKQEVDSKISEPSDDEAKGYYLAVKAQTSLAFDDVKAQVKQLIRNNEIQQARDKYADSLRGKSEVSILLQPSSATVHVSYDAARVQGNPDAPVTIVDQCPFCKKTEDTLKALLSKYGDRVKLAFLDFPLSEIHGQAGSAAEAARCAGDQGKYWEYHDSLFAEPSKLDEASLIERAQKLRLDESAFRSCLTSGKFQKDIQENREQGVEAGVKGTPAFFINGVFLSGAQPQAEFEKIIDSQLALKGNGERLP